MTPTILSTKWTPTIVLTKQGEKLITAVDQLIDPETGNAVGFIFKCPYVLNTIPSDEKQFSVNFTKWIPYSIDNVFKVPYDVVVTTGKPEPDILNIYIKKFREELNDDVNDDDTPPINRSEMLDYIYKKYFLDH